MLDIPRQQLGSPEHLPLNPNVADAREIYLASQGTQVLHDPIGTGNVVGAAHMTYDGLYNKAVVVEMHGLDRHMFGEQFPDTIPLLERPLPQETSHIPGRQEFVELIRDTVTRKIDHQACLYPGAQDIVRTMTDGGNPTIIWTQGDHDDAPGARPVSDQFGGYTPADRVGSFDQLKKVFGGGFATLRREQAIARFGIERPDRPTPAQLRDTLAVFASTHKFDPGVLDKMAAHFTEREICDVVVLEDRSKNLRRLEQEFAMRGVTVHGILVRQGKHGSSAETPAGMVAVDTLAEAQNIIEADYKNRDARYGYVSDLDDVLSNQEIRRQLQADMVAEALAARGWI